MRRLSSVFVFIAVTLAVAPGAALAVEPHPQTGPLPGFPRERGVIPVVGSSAAMAAHEQQVNGAFSAARTEAHAVEPSRQGGSCPAEPYAFTQDVCYQGGPVLRKPIVHLIFWLGPTLLGNHTTPTTLHVSAFPSLYRSTIERYFTDVAHDKGGLTDVYAVDPQYSDTQGAGVNDSAFEASDVQVDEKAFPSRTEKECPGFAEGVAEGPCVLDSDIQEQVELLAGTPNAGLGSIYFVFTAPGVSSCAAFGCSYHVYCAYHGDFGGNGLTPGNQTIYANMPFAAPGVCDSGVHPNEAEDKGTDAAIDVTSHEFNEAITDPLGSQCKNAATGECEPFSWTDIIGQEMADKCLPPETTIGGIYGEPLGKTAFTSGFYNQLIDSNPYWTQTEWSNQAGAFEGRCVQRMLPTAFTAPTEAKATVPATFDGASSGEAGDPAVYWVWSFGDRMQAGTPEAKTAHTYAQAGVYTVTLTAFDAYGNSNTHTMSVSVGAAPPPPPPPPAPEPITFTRTVTVLVPSEPTSYSAAQLAQKLGLPPNGTTLSGRGVIGFGHAECPPACTLVVRLYATRHATVHRRRVVKRVFIGALTTSIAAKGTGTLALTLNATGRKLLHKGHRLSAQLLVTVTGREGGSWQLTRMLTLTR
jgi:hypothetical protein